MHRWKTFVAIGDSFTEGLDDPAPDGSYRGWADRLAAMLAEGNPDFRYANTAVRGKLLHQIVQDQVPQAVAARPDLVAFSGGGNDILRPGGDPDALADLYERGVRELRAAGCEVLVFTGFDTKGTPVMSSLRGRVATYNSHLRAIADRYSCPVVDLWSMTVLRDSRAWSEDRLHLSPEGHQRVALRVADVLGLPSGRGWDAPWPQVEQPDWVSLRRADLKWAREHLVPWLGRRLRGESSGDGRQAKRPDLLPL
ncbi:SGNH/GDSL hydrolase family protein [Goodfellowiella coeruleoviolacea]|uniref:Lysophospholipase L1 n=1 Tax=Goodfellowiella coeruleoviolacea TaxID=334858 RepID=A0AAE3KE02_9PSEU|nr:SGNH/GDSL hydrolase family protein [Goodfellowiella coeruleoviolacea]MCP2164736.1 Lysophospholipase L1 [Goodfellowiella coeruleoviolacea]